MLFRVHNIKFPLYRAYSTCYSLHCTLYNVQYTLYTEYTVYTVYYTVYIAQQQCTVYLVECAASMPVISPLPLLSRDNPCWSPPTSQPPLLHCTDILLYFTTAATAVLYCTTALLHCCTISLHCTVLHCSTLHCTVLYCTVLPYTMVLNCIAVHCYTTMYSIYSVPKLCEKFILCINLLFLSTAMIINATKQLRAYLKKAADGPQMNFSKTFASRVRKCLSRQIRDKHVNTC